MTAFQDLLESRKWILADGATGTNLFGMGLEAGEPPEFWNEAHPERVEALYQGSVDAGSDLFLTNSFGGNRCRLKLHGAESRARELSRAAAEIARGVADRAGGFVAVGGSIGPTGEIMGPAGSLSLESAVEIFHEQAEGLKEGGVDVLWVETLSSEEELRAAGEAARLCGLPWCATMSFDTAGRTMMGISPPRLVSIVESMDYPPLAFGANCGVGASDLVRTVLAFGASGSGRRIVAKANAGIPKFKDGHIHYDGTPELMADYALLARDAGAMIIGGCCGTAPRHLESMRRALESTEPGPLPSLDLVARKLGDFSFGGDGSGEGAGLERRPRGGRRRPGMK